MTPNATTLPQVREPAAATRRGKKRLKDLRGKVALVTGAGRGIGAATALALADAGARLLLCDIDEDGLNAVERQVNERSTCLIARQVDVGDRDAMRTFAAEVHLLVPCVDVLINNAGIALQASLLETPLEEWDRLLSVNLYGVIHGCSLFLPAMVARGEGGHVVNLSSVVGFSAPPGLNSYATSKFAVFGLSESLRAELAPHGIGVSTICPGTIDSGMIQRVRFLEGEDPSSRHAWTAKLIERHGYGTERVARAILKAIRRDRDVVPVTPESWALYYLKRFSPGAVALLWKIVHDWVVKEETHA